MGTYHRYRTIWGEPAIAAAITAIVLAGCSHSDVRKGRKPDSGVWCDGPCVDWPTGSGDTRDAEAKWEGGKPASCPPQPLPPDVPDGWEEYPVMDCQHRIYVPSSREYLPPPLTWEPCTYKTVPITYNCRHLRMDWPGEQPTPYSLGGDQPAYVDSNGKVVIQVRKVHMRPETVWWVGAMGMVAEADGHVRQAFWKDYAPNNRGVSLDGRGAAPGKSSWAITEMVEGYPGRVVSFGGDDTVLRPAILSDFLRSDSDISTAVAGTHFYLQTGGNWRVRRWDGTDMGVVGYGGSDGSAQWVGPTLLYALAASPNYAVLRWTEQDGTRVLVGFGSDDSRGAGNPGSDGKYLVWVQGEGRDGDSTQFPQRWIMTSRYSTDPAAIQPRRLTRWLSYLIAGRTPAVGCG